MGCSAGKSTQLPIGCVQVQTKARKVICKPQPRHSNFTAKPQVVHLKKTPFNHFPGSHNASLSRSTS